MRIDLTHCGERASFDVLEMELAHPPIFSHSNARALYEHERNITDTQIRTARDAGSYIGINGVGFFLGATGVDIPKEMARHAAHIAEIAGADKLGVGLDYMYLDGSDYGFYHSQKHRWPRGYPTPPWSFYEVLTRARSAESSERIICVSRWPTRRAFPYQNRENANGSRSFGFAPFSTQSAIISATAGAMAQPWPFQPTA